jgi:hypothetical protein
VNSSRVATCAAAPSTVVALATKLAINATVHLNERLDMAITLQRVQASMATLLA